MRVMEIPHTPQRGEGKTGGWLALTPSGGTTYESGNMYSAVLPVSSDS